MFWFLSVVIALLVVMNGIITYAILRYRLLDIHLSAQRAGRFAVLYFGLFLGMMPFLYLAHKKILACSLNSMSWFVIVFLSLGTILFLGPFLYAYFLQRKSYFNDYTIAGLAHELKNPLGSIEHAVESLMGERGEYPMNSKQTEYLEMIDRNTYRLRTYVENLLHVFKFKVDKELSLELVEIRMLCHKVVEPFRDLAAVKGISIQENFQPNDIMVLCDPEKIEQTISNLISNAIKFTKEGIIRVGVEEKKDRVIISVEDSGQGIPREELPYVFDRFYQGRFGRWESKGTGLGLAIAKTWVLAHHGEIYAESEGPGKGSRLCFSLPK